MCHIKQIYCFWMESMWLSQLESTSFILIIYVVWFHCAVKPFMGYFLLPCYIYKLMCTWSVVKYISVAYGMAFIIECDMKMDICLSISCDKLWIAWLFQYINHFKPYNTWYKIWQLTDRWIYIILWLFQFGCPDVWYYYIIY